MEISFNVDGALFAMQSLSPVLNAKNPMPILDSVKVEVLRDDNIMRITGGDLETQLTLPVPIIDASDNITFCVNASKFMSILAKLRGLTLTLEMLSESKEIKGKYKGGSFKMTYDDASEYPMIELGEQTGEAVFDNGTPLHDALRNTIFATSTDEIRPVMTGVYFDFTDEGLVCVGTDGRILNKYVNANVNCQNESFILPKKPSNALRALVAKHDSLIRLTCDNKCAVFASDAFVLICRLIDGKYPNYNSVIPKECKEEVFVNRVSLISALSRVSVFQPSSELVVLDFKRNALTLTCQDIDFSTSGNETITCSYDSDVALKIGLKVSLLDSVLKNMETDDVHFKMIDGTRAVVIEPFGGNTNVTSLIMPMVVD